MLLHRTQYSSGQAQSLTLGPVCPSGEPTNVMASLLIHVRLNPQEMKTPKSFPAETCGFTFLRSQE